MRPGQPLDLGDAPATPPPAWSTRSTIWPLWICVDISEASGQGSGPRSSGGARPRSRPDQRCEHHEVHDRDRQRSSAASPTVREPHHGNSRYAKNSDRALSSTLRARRRPAHDAEESQDGPGGPRRAGVEKEPAHGRSTLPRLKYGCGRPLFLLDLVHPPSCRSDRRQPAGPCPRKVWNLARTPCQTSIGAYCRPTAR